MHHNLRVILSLAAVLALSACESMPSWLGGAEPEIVKLPGERLAVLPVPAEMQPDPALQTIPVSLPAPAGNADWPQHAAFPSVASNLALSGSLGQSNSASAGDGESFERVLIPRPVAGGGLVFAMDAEGKVSAHDMTNIDDKKWVSDGVFDEDEEDANGGGLAYDNGVLYAISGRGALAAIDASSGTILWSKAGYPPFRSMPKVSGGKLFAITIGSELIAFDTKTGEALWNHRGIDETTGLMNAVSPAISGDIIIVPYESGELYALSATDGRELWGNSLTPGKRTQASGIFSGIGGDPAVDGEVVFAVGSGGVVAAYGIPYGQRLWERQVPAINAPWVAGDYLFLISADNTLMAMVKYDGRVRWSTQLASFEDEKRKLYPILWRGPVLVGGNLAVVNSRGEMLLVSAADGTIQSTIDIPDDVYTAPIVAGGRMYLVTKSAKLYSLQ